MVGANLSVYINGKLFGRTSGINFTSSTPHKPIQCLDSIEPYELAVTTTALNGTLAIYRLHGDAGIQGAGLVANFVNLSKSKYFTLMIVDRSTSYTVFRAKHCVINSESWTMPVNGIVKGDVSFEGIEWDNEF